MNPGKFCAGGDPKNRPLITWPARQTGLNSKINTSANAHTYLWLNKNHKLFNATGQRKMKKLYVSFLMHLVLGWPFNLTGKF